MQKTNTLLKLSTSILLVCAGVELSAEMALEETFVIGDALSKDTRVVSATSTINTVDLEDINFATAEDAIAYQPSVIVRRRFIGDPNGVIGIRGSNMFQGAHSMVFADGMPLHYHLQTRFSGSPRWSLVAPSEIQEAEIIYGPFSAEYSGNAIGGVVNLKTKRPNKRKITIEGMLFNQDYSIWATDENYQGGRAYLAYEDGGENYHFHVAYNHLQNDSQPQTQYRSTLTSNENPIDVSGGFSGSDERNRNVVYYGDSGPENAVTDLFKFKGGYDFGAVQFRTTVAYEQRTRDLDEFNNFLVNANASPIWNGTVRQGENIFSVRGSNFQERDQERDSLLLGLGLSGQLSTSWIFDAFYSNFQILDDREIRSARNPADPDFTSQNEGFRGRITEYDDTGWDIFDVKFGTDALFGDQKQRISLGFHQDAYELNIIADDYNSISNTRDADEIDGNLSSGRGDSGGKASTIAVFAQYGYALSDQWDLALGLRAEEWETKNGYSGGNRVDDRKEEGVSPKFSLGYFPKETITLRYSLARAIRFPIIEELYRNDGAASSGSVFISDPTLSPEDGVFHNLSIEKSLQYGSVRLNAFYDTLEDVIFNQSTSTDTGTVTTSLPVGETTTKGLEFIYNQRNLFSSKLRMRFNVSYVNSEITENILNPTVIGKDFPRMPNWRGNLVLGYELSPTLDLSTSIRYASNSFGNLENSDVGENVFGAHDGFIFVNAKARLKANEGLSFALGIDNINNEEAYVFHPWPSRTIYLEAKASFGE